MLEIPLGALGEDHIAGIRRKRRCSVIVFPLDIKIKKDIYATSDILWFR